eukprot:2978041-Rhodomonas_salina.3
MEKAKMMSAGSTPKQTDPTSWCVMGVSRARDCRRMLRTMRKLTASEMRIAPKSALYMPSR